MKKIVVYTLVFAFATSLVFAYGHGRRFKDRLRGLRNGRENDRGNRFGKLRQNMKQYAEDQAKSVQKESSKKSDTSALSPSTYEYSYDYDYLDDDFDWSEILFDDEWYSIWDEMNAGMESFLDETENDDDTDHL